MIEKLFYKLLIIYISFTIIKALFVIGLNYTLERLKAKTHKKSNKFNKPKKLITELDKKELYRNCKYYKKELTYIDYLNFGHLNLCKSEIFYILAFTILTILNLFYNLSFIFNL